MSYWDGLTTVVMPPIPAVVGHDQAGQVVVGRFPAGAVDGATPGIKRRLGNGGGRVRSRTREYPPQEIAAFLLIELKRQAEAAIGDPVHDAVITVPTTYGEPERRLLIEAAGLAQLNVRRLLDEPIAAAVAAGATTGPGTYAIYDLGGGTFDAAIVRISHRRPSSPSDNRALTDPPAADSERPPVTHPPPSAGGRPSHQARTTWAAVPRPAGVVVGSPAGADVPAPADRAGVQVSVQVSVLATHGDPYLGGDDFDDQIVGHVLRQIRERYHVDLSQDESIRRRICREAELRKRELSTAETAVLELPLLTATVSASIPLTRRAFEAMIGPDLTTTFQSVATALAEAGLTPADLDQVLLTGGSTRIPAIRAGLADQLGLPLADIRDDLDPDDLIARGAATVARDYEPASLFDGAPLGLLSANLRLRAEMAAPEPDPELPVPPPAGDLGTAGALPEPPAETPADFRPVADAGHARLSTSADDDHPALRAAYLAFVAAIHAAAPDTRLTALGTTLTTAYTESIGVGDEGGPGRDGPAGPDGGPAGPSVPGVR
ncbi:Hsp70 family protein [Micromonosporaceae bacterium Da 78-11]